MEHMLRSIRVGVRALRRTPGFAFTAILTLAVGIGLATAVFTVSDAFLLRPLPVREAGRVVVLWGVTSDGRFDNFPLLLDDARDFARRVRSLEQTEFFSYGGAHLVPIRDGNTVFRVRRALVSGGYFDLLGARPLIGRTIRPDDDVIGAPRVAVLSHGAWRRYFGADSGIVGQRLILHGTGEPQTIVGVMPPGLDYPRGVDFWAPVIPSSGAFGDIPVYAELNIVGRLRPGASVADARDELTAFFGRPEAPAWHRDLHGVAHPLINAILGDVRPAALGFAAAAALLLFITCINVANLLLVRGLVRVKEIALRSALGAGRGTIVGQLLTESAILAAGGGALGILLAALAVRAFVALAPTGTPRLDEIHLNGTALAAASTITIVVMLLSALVPALVSARVAPQEALRAGLRQSDGGRRLRRGTEMLIVGQVAVALLLLSAAGLITRSLMKLERVELAFDPSSMLIAELAIPHDGFGDASAQLALLDRLLPRLEAIPGIRAVSPVLTPPFVAVGGIFGQLRAEGQSAAEASRNPTLIMDVVASNHFTMFGIPILHGRGFAENDRAGGPAVAIISESAARHYWGEADPIGKRLMMRGDGAVTIIGIVPETRYRDLRDPRPTVYFPLRQSSFPVAPMTLAIRADADATELVPVIRRVIVEVQPGVALASASPFATLLQVPLAQPRLNALLLSVFAVAAVVLAAVGLFGVMATLVRQRTRELGVRMALGATAADIGRLVLRRGMTLAGAGTMLGLIGALMANRLLAALLFDVTPTDVTTLALVATLLLVVGALATLIPARSSTRIAPAVALRAE